jgi:phenylpropionate dioxygenase-like ring-hydroxylating dioxygenase large terminal subunit
VKLLKNIWYVAAWSTEIGQQFVSRTLLGDPLLLYRKGDGTPVVLLDRCPHRFAPLSMGRRVGDDVECGYHGLQFDCSGKCVRNPHGNGRIPDAARVRRFPAADRHGLLWIWAGDEGRADTDLIPDYGHLVSPDLMDLSHVNYLHAPYQQVDDFLQARHDIEQEGASVVSRRTIDSTRAPRSFRPFLADPEAPVEYWLDIRWRAPGCCQLETGVVAVGRPRDQGVVRIGTHIVTPQTDASSIYFYASSRNYRLDDPRADEETSRWHQIGFHEQDKPMIEAVQTRMGDSDLLSQKPLLLATDAAAIRTRRMLQAMIEEEAGTAMRTAAA